MSDQSKKKLPSIIELSSDSTSPTTSDYKPTDDIEMKEEDHDSQESDSYEQASSSSCKWKLKTTFSSRKTKQAAGDQSDKELPPSKPSKGKQCAQVTGKRRSTRRIASSPLLVQTSSDEGNAPQRVPVHQSPSVQSKHPSPEQRTQPSAAEAGKQPIVAHHMQLPAEAQAQLSQPLTEARVSPSTTCHTQPPVEARVQPSTLFHTQLPVEAHVPPSTTRHIQPPAEACGQPSTSHHTQPPADARGQPSIAHHTRPPAEAQVQPSTARHAQLPAEAQVQPSSVEDPPFYSVDVRPTPSTIRGM